MKPIIQYIGSKNKLAKWIISHFPPHNSYVEPFVGSGAIILNKPPCKLETINDSNRDIYDMFAQIRQNPTELAALLWATPFHENEHKEQPENALDKTRLFITKTQHCFTGSSEGFSFQKCESWSPKQQTWSRWCDRVIPVAQRLKNVQILNRDALDIITYFKDSDCLMYVDPPYYGMEKNYKMKVDYSRMVDLLLSAKCKVCISEFESALKFFPGWRVVKKEVPNIAANHKAKRKTNVECLIMNYGEK